MEALYLIYSASLIILGIAVMPHMQRMTDKLTRQTDGRVSPLKIDIIAVCSILCVILLPGLNTFLILKGCYIYCQVNFFHKEL